MTVLIETIRVHQGTAPLWPRHVERLETSCRALGVPMPGGLDPPAGGLDRVVRLLVTQNGVERSEREVGSLAPVRLITAKAVHKPYPHKTVARAQFEKAAAESTRAKVDDALLLTDEGWVAESSIFSVFWWDGDRLCAPSLALGILPGVARARLAELAGGIEERRIRPVHLVQTGLFLANAARGVVEVSSWDGLEVPTQPLTRGLRERFWP